MSNTQSIHGLMAGTAFILTLEGQAGVSGTVPTVLAPTEGVSATIEVTRSVLGTAPECVYFKVTGWTGFDTGPGPFAGRDARHNDLLYFWEFGDPGSTFTAPVKVLAEWQDANKAQGAFVAHEYGPGSFEWSVLILEPSSGKTCTIRSSDPGYGPIVVADPDVTFAGTRTSYWAPNGDFSDCPVSIPVEQRYTVLKNALDQLRRVEGGVRLMVARGINTIVDAQSSVPEFSSNLDWILKGIHIVAGPGSKPRPIMKLGPEANHIFIMRYTGSIEDPRELTVTGLDCRGWWDSTTESFDPAGNGSTKGNGIECQHVGYTHIGDSRFTGFHIALGRGENDNSKNEGDYLRSPISKAKSNACSMSVCDVHITNWENFGFFGVGFGKFAWLGTTVAQDPEAISGGGKTSGRNGVNHNYHGPIRNNNNNPHDLFMDCCDLFSTNGWFYNQGYYTQQACFRLNQMMIDNSHHNIQRSAFEGGWHNLAITRMNPSGGSGPLDVLVDHCILVGSHGTTGHIMCDGTGVTVRNCLAVHPRIPRLNGTNIVRGFVMIQGSSQNLFTPPTKIYNNTFINLMSVDVGGERANDSVHPNSLPILWDNTPEDLTASVTIENNIVHQPNTANPQTAFGPLDQTPLWEPRALGYTQAYELASHVLTADWLPGQTIQVPYPGPRADYDPVGSVAVGAYGTNFGGKYIGINVTTVGGAATIAMTNDSTTQIIPNGMTINMEVSHRNRIAPHTPAQKSPLDTVWNGRPLPGSSAIGATTSDETSYDDIRGKVRPIHPSVGAAEAAG